MMRCNNVMICSNLASFWKFRRPLYNPVEHLWWSFYCKNSKQLSIFTEKLHRRCSLWFYAPAFWRLFKRFIFRSICLEVFCEKGVLKNVAKFTGKHLCQSLYFNKVACNFIKIETLAQVFSCEFCEISKNTISYRTPPVAVLYFFKVFQILRFLKSVISL